MEWQFYSFFAIKKWGANEGLVRRLNARGGLLLATLPHVDANTSVFTTFKREGEGRWYINLDSYRIGKSKALQAH